MIDLLGFKRLLKLAVLVAVNIVLASMVYGHLIPQEKQVEIQTRSLQNQIFEVESDIEKLRADAEILQAQQADFKQLEEEGFFLFQSRREAQDLIENIQAASRVITSTASIEPGSIVENKEAAKAGYGILVSPVKVNIDAYDDLDIYNYLFLMSREFPGHLAVDNITITRVADLDNTVLRGIAGGENIPLVSAEVNLLWRTMVKDTASSGGMR